MLSSKAALNLRSWNVQCPWSHIAPKTENNRGLVMRKELYHQEFPKAQHLYHRELHQVVPTRASWLVPSRHCSCTNWCLQSGIFVSPCKDSQILLPRKLGLSPGNWNRLMYPKTGICEVCNSKCVLVSCAEGPQLRALSTHPGADSEGQ
jgi:hypothetical protein